MQEGEVPLDQNPEITLSQNDGDEADKDKAVVKQKEEYDTQQRLAQELPTRVVISDDSLRQWPFSTKEFFNFLIQLLNIIAVLVFGIWAIRSYNEAVTANQLSSNSIQAAQAANLLTMFQICQESTGQALPNCYPILDNVILAQPLQNALSSDLSIYATQKTSSSLTTSSTLTTSVSTSLPSLSSRPFLTSEISSNLLSATLPGAPSSTEPSSPTTAPTQTIPSSNSTSPQGSSPQSSSLSFGAEIGLIVGGVSSITLIVLLALMFSRYRRRRARQFQRSSTVMPK